MLKKLSPIFIVVIFIFLPQTPATAQQPQPLIGIPTPCDLFENKSCNPLDAVKSAAGSVASSGFEAVAEAFAAGAEEMLQATMTSWLEVDAAGSVNSGAIGVFQGNLSLVTGFVAVLALIAGAVRFAISNGRDGAEDLKKGMIRFIIISFAGIAILEALILAGDEFSTSIVESSTGGNFGNGGNLIVFTGFAPGLVFLFAILGIITSIIQIGMLFVRSAVIVILAGLWPIAAASSMHPSGEMFWRKISAWLLAFVLYKPAAAICYSAAFILMNDKAGEPTISSLIQGMIILLMAVLALPALIRLLVPAAASLPMGPSAGSLIAGGAAVATGAVVIASTGGAGAVAAGASSVAGGASKSGGEFGKMLQPSGSEG